MNQHWTKRSGGRKHQELKIHRDNVLWLIDMVGLEEACRILNVKRVETLESLANSGEERPRSLTVSEKADLRSKVAIAGLDELRLTIKKSRHPRLELERFDGYLIRICEDDE